MAQPERGWAIFHMRPQHTRQASLSPAKLNPPATIAFVGISGRSYRPRVSYRILFLAAACGRGFESRRRHPTPKEDKQNSCP